MRACCSRRGSGLARGDWLGAPGQEGTAPGFPPHLHWHPVMLQLGHGWQQALPHRCVAGAASSGKEASEAASWSTHDTGTSRELVSPVLSPGNPDGNQEGLCHWVPVTSLQLRNQVYPLHIQGCLRTCARCTWLWWAPPRSPCVSQVHHRHWTSDKQLLERTRTGESLLQRPISEPVGPDVKLCQKSARQEQWRGRNTERGQHGDPRSSCMRTRLHRTRHGHEGQAMGRVSDLP